MSASQLPSSGVTPSGNSSVAKVEPSRTPHFDKLKGKQRAFVEEYFVDLNGTQAAIRAGYSVTSARDIACENLTKPHIAAAIDELMSARQGITRTRIVDELARIAFANAADFFDFDQRGVRLVDKGDLSRDQLAAIASVSQATGNTDKVELKLHDKMAALTLLAKVTGLARDKEGASVNVNVQTNVKTGVMVLPEVVSEDDWEREAEVERKREAAINAKLRNVA